MRNTGQTAARTSAVLPAALRRGTILDVSEGVSISELTSAVGEILAPGNFADPAVERDALLAAVAGRSRGELQLDRLLARVVDSDTASSVLSAARARVRRVPLQHIAGVAPFFDIELAVGPGVFVPRPETEQLVAFALEALSSRERFSRDAAQTVLDIGSGSGAIAITLSRHLPDLRVVATEASAYAWPWLRRNVRALAPDVDARFGDWRNNVPDGPLRAIISNPPYVPVRAIPSDPEVRLFDPELALYSGDDGLQEIRRIGAVAGERLQAGGVVAVEHTEEQGAAVATIFSGFGLVDARTFPDLSGRPRFTAAWHD